MSDKDELNPFQIKDLPTPQKKHSYSRAEINHMIAEQLGICIEPICQEIGKAIESLQKRIQDLEAAGNAMITEMKEWKSKSNRTIQ